MYTAGAKQRGGEGEWEGFIYERRRGGRVERKNTEGWTATMGE